MAKLKREPRAATASVINSDGACADLAVTERIEEVVPAWDDLEARGLALPSQRRAVVEAWIESQRLQARDCVFVSARIGGRPLLVVPLLRRRHLGAREVTWLMGDHFGAYAPLVDVALMAQMPPEARRTLWRRLFA